MSKISTSDLKGGEKITRSAAIAKLRALPPTEIAGVVFVARGDDKTGPYLCQMSFRTDVRKHLKGGSRAYKPAEHGLMGVFEVMNQATALKLFREAAEHDVEELEPQIAPNEAALAQAQKALAAKRTKKNENAVRVKQNKLNALNAKLALARLKLTDPVEALKQEIGQRIENRMEEIAALEKEIGDGKGDVAALNEKLEETQARLAKERQYLADPMQSLLNRYRMINLTGLVELTIGGKTYRVTTPPQPPIPDSAKAPAASAGAQAQTTSTGAPRALRIDKQGENIVVRALVPERFTRHGFGTFLEGVKPGEISISKEAKDALLRCRYLSGLQGMEIFNRNILAWGAPSLHIAIPLNGISLHNGAAQWFDECSVVESA
ncbi:MAG TPA: hypothetical protein V6D17_11415 [Candidatus Obscuribacterales bacterium]